MSTSPGKLYLIPCHLGDLPQDPGVHPSIIATCNQLDGFLAENPKTCRKFLKLLPLEKPLQNFFYEELHKRSDHVDLNLYLGMLKEGKNLGIISEAGCPGIADPGAHMVSLAQRNNIQVIPLIGPSSILLALMASGMSGQQFAFHGYLPIEGQALHKKANECVQRANLGESQIVMETPYRNLRLFDTLLKVLPSDFKLCVAANITQEGEWIKTKAVSEWKKTPKPPIDKIPTIMVFAAG